jgi:Ca2+-binding EF-hand superfamily protein
MSRISFECSDGTSQVARKRIQEAEQTLSQIKELNMKTFIKYTTLGVLSLGLVGASVTAASAFGGGKGGGHERPSFETLDINSDGFITAEDAEAKRLEWFTSADTDSDGFLSVDELQAAPKGMRGGKRGGRGGEDHAGKGEGKKARSAEEMADHAARMLRFLDENGDGKVAFDEMPNRGEGRMIARLDTDDDGKISPEEFEAAKGKFGKRKMKRGDADAN